MRPPALSKASITTMEGASLISSVRGLKESPQTAKVRPVRSSPKWRFTFSTRIPFCRSLTRSTALSSGISRRGSPMPISARMSLGKRGAAVPYSRKEKRGPEAPVQADSAPDFIHIGADFLAKIGNFVDEGDFRGQHAIGGVLAHLRAARIHNEDRVSRANKRLVELFNEFDRLGIVAAQDHPVRLHEILDRSALF